MAMSEQLTTSRCRALIASAGFGGAPVAFEGPSQVAYNYVILSHIMS